MKKIEELEKDLQTNKLQNIYLLYGEEQFLLEQFIKKIKKIFGECTKGINYIQIDESNISNLISDIETPSFGYEKKLIIVKNSGLFKKEGKRKSEELSKLKKNIAKYIEENIKLINESIILVFIEEDIEKSELYKTIDKLGIVCNFEYQKPAQIIQRLKVICKQYDVNIDNITLQYLIECCGTNMQDLINEIRKLIEYAGKGGTIQKQDIDKLCTKKLESVIFDLTDNLGKKNISKSLEVLKNLLYEKEPLQKILITLYNHFKKLYLTNIAIYINKDIVTSLDLKPNQTFLVNKYKMQSKYFKQNELEAMLKDLCDLDYKSKNGLIDLQIGLETVLCNYCGGR